ncbi:MAG: hypothetical protein ACRYG8_29290, partial [Janthinobacterium lividum]
MSEASATTPLPTASSKSRLAAADDIIKTPSPAGDFVSSQYLDENGADHSSPMKRVKSLALQALTKKSAARDFRGQSAERRKSHEQRQLERKKSHDHAEQTRQYLRVAEETKKALESPKIPEVRSTPSASQKLKTPRTMTPMTQQEKRQLQAKDVREKVEKARAEKATREGQDAQMENSSAGSQQSHMRKTEHRAGQANKPTTTRQESGNLRKHQSSERESEKADEDSQSTEIPRASVDRRPVEQLRREAAAKGASRESPAVIDDLSDDAEGKNMLPPASLRAALNPDISRKSASKLATPNTSQTRPQTFAVVVESPKKAERTSISSAKVTRLSDPSLPAAKLSPSAISKNAGMTKSQSGQARAGPSKAAPFILESASESGDSGKRKAVAPSQQSSSAPKKAKTQSTLFTFSQTSKTAPNKGKEKAGSLAKPPVEIELSDDDDANADQPASTFTSVSKIVPAARAMAQKAKTVAKSLVHEPSQASSDESVSSSAEGSEAVREASATSEESSEGSATGSQENNRLFEHDRVRTGQPVSSPSSSFDANAAEVSDANAAEEADAKVAEESDADGGDDDAESLPTESSDGSEFDNAPDDVEMKAPDDSPESTPADERRDKMESDMDVVLQRNALDSTAPESTAVSTMPFPSSQPRPTDDVGVVVQSQSARSPSIQDPREALSAARETPPKKTRDETPDWMTPD